MGFKPYGKMLMLFGRLMLSTIIRKPGKVTAHYIFLQIYYSALAKYFMFGYLHIYTWHISNEQTCTHIYGLLCACQAAAQAN